MATCVPHPAPPPPPLAEKYVLALTAMEAQVLFTVLTLVGGDPDTTPRHYSDRILKALEGAGMCEEHSLKRFVSERLQHGIYFDAVPNSRYGDSK